MNITYAGRIFKNAQVFDFRTLVRSNNNFNQKTFDKVRAAANRCNNTAGIWTHPLCFSESVIKGLASHISNNDHVKKVVSQESYKKYLSNVLTDLRANPDRPEFVFYDPGEKLFATNPFLEQNIDLQNPLIFVQTEIADPVPNFFNRRRPALLKYLEWQKASGETLLPPIINETIVRGPGSDLYDMIADHYNESYKPKIKYRDLDRTYIYNRQRSLELLRTTFEDLGFESFVIRGEKGFSIANGDGSTTDIGCAFVLYHKLNKMSFNCTLDMNMIFPGVIVPKDR